MSCGDHPQPAPDHRGADEGRGSPIPSYGVTGKQRSLHNTYLTLPVLLMMISNHYPMLTNHPQSWLLVALIVVGGACLRHFLARHEVGDPLRDIAWTLPFIFGALAVAVVMTAPRIEDVSALPKVGDEDGSCHQPQALRHVSCQASRPTKSSPRPPRARSSRPSTTSGAYAVLIEKQTVQTNAMPLGNETGMTDDERRTLGVWLRQNR